ncbi:thymidine kinase [Equid herpesvirus 6]|uniref:Thymidine kinase n=1 Tax=Equid herpesvirus 6 TaxID=173566 RepID=A0A7S9VMY8_9ALPH|nr:thymidine kinase [Equid herpesvirus 6]QPI70149.1 thymidine kinase [Equid herpesvirus 6]
MAARGAADARAERAAADRRVTLVRVYLDGVYGVGKSTTARVMASTGGRGSPTLYFPEPMAYWRTLFETDVIGGIYETQDRKLSGGLAEADASLITAHYQSRFATPYLLLHDHTSGLFGGEEMPRGAGAADLVLIFDRHPVAATVCFPAARYLLGDMPMSALLAMVATLPPEPPGANLVVATLDADEHVRRLRGRARIGEQIDVQLIAALRNVYAMLVNTSRFLQSGRVWRDGWGQLPPFGAGARRRAAQPSACSEREYPELGDTLFGLFKAPELMDERGVLLEVHAWALDALMGRLRHLRVFSADLGGTPRQCAAAVDALMPLMSSTVTGGAAAAALERAARSFSAEMGV